MNWIQQVVEANSENEAPSKFFYWAALASLSAVVGKKLRLQRHFYYLYPNIYVFLVARSGMKKGIPVTLAKKIVENTSATRVISGRNSVPAIIQTLGKAYTLPGKPMVKDGVSFIVTGELGASFASGPGDLTIMTELHNTHEHEEKWVNTLKGSGVDEIKSPCLTFLAATNEEHFVNSVPQADVKGGFIARTFIVYSAERGTPNSLVYAPTKLIDINALSEFPKEVAKLKGEFKWTPKGGKVYDDWYQEFVKNYPDDPTGTFNRIGDQIIKIAMLISLSKNFDLELDEDSILEARAAAFECADGMNKVTMGTGPDATVTQAARLIMRELIQSTDHKATRQKMMSRLWQAGVSAQILDIAIETLHASNAIEVQRYGKETTLVLQASMLDKYVNFKQRIQ